MLGIIDESDIIKIGRKITTARYGYVNHTNTLCHICNMIYSTGKYKHTNNYDQ